MHAWGLRLRRVRDRLALASVAVSPSATWYGVGTPDAIISQLNALPACAPVNASMVALRLATHDSGSEWFATPFPRDSFIHNSTPVYPGALSTLVISAFEMNQASFQQRMPSWLRPGGVFAPCLVALELKFQRSFQVIQFQ